MTADPEDDAFDSQAAQLTVPFRGGPLADMQATVPLDRAYYRDRRTGAEYRLVTEAPTGALVSYYQFLGTFRA